MEYQTEAKDRMTVGAAIDQCHKAAGGISDRLEHLESRLMPVLEDSDTVKAQAGSAPTAVPVIGSLFGLQDRLSELSDRISDLADRVAL